VAGSGSGPLLDSPTGPRYNACAPRLAPPPT